MANIEHPCSGQLEYSNMATLQQQVQQHLDNTGISLRELSRRSGVSRWTISSILKGGVYKSDTAHALYSLISITPISEYVTLHDKVESIAAERVECDLVTRDDALECGKQRRIEALEAELTAYKRKATRAENKAKQQAEEIYQASVAKRKLRDIIAERAVRVSQLDMQLKSAQGNAESRDKYAQDLAKALANAKDVLVQREQHLKSCENALIEANEKIAKQDAWIEQEDGARNILQSNLRDANAEIKRLTALVETHGQSWKAACVQVEQLQKQLADKRENYQELYEHSIKQGKDEKAMLAKMDELYTQLMEHDNNATLHDQQVMRLRVCIWILIAALAFVVVSGFMVLRGAA